MSDEEFNITPHYEAIKVEVTNSEDFLTGFNACKKVILRILESYIPAELMKEVGLYQTLDSINIENLGKEQ